MIGQLRKLLWWALGVFISVFILGVLFSRFDARSVLDVAGDAWKLPLGMALILSVSANLALSSWQWRTTYNELGYKIPLGEHIFVKSALYPLRAALPLRAGDLGRAFYMSINHHVPTALSIGVQGIILITNLSILLYMSIIGFLVAELYIFSILALLLLVVLVITVVIGRNTLVRFGKVDFENGNWFERQVEKMKPVAGISLGSLMPIALLGLTTLLAQIVTFSLIAMSFNVPIPPQKVFAYTPIIMLAGSLPISLMGLGIREWTTLKLLALFAEPETLLSMGIMFSVVDQLFLAFIGLIALPPFIFSCRSKDWPSVREW